MRWVSAPEFTEWMAYAELEPFGPDAEAWRAGVIASTIANVYRDRKKRSKAYTPQDFMPEEPTTPAERARTLTERIGSAMMSLGGQVRPRGAPRRPRTTKPSAAVALLRASGAAPRPARTRRPTRKE